MGYRRLRVRCSPLRLPCTGSNGSFQIDFYKDDLDFSRVIPLKHLTVSIEAKGHYRLAPFLFDQSGRYRLNVKTAGNTQLMQRSFEVVRIGKGGAIQAYTGRNTPQVTLPNGTAVTRIGLVVGSEAPLGRHHPHGQGIRDTSPRRERHSGRSRFQISSI